MFVNLTKETMPKIIIQEFESGEKRIWKKIKKGNNFYLYECEKLEWYCYMVKKKEGQNYAGDIFEYKNIGYSLYSFFKRDRMPTLLDNYKVEEKK